MARNFPCDVNSQAALADQYKIEARAEFTAYLRFKKLGLLNVRSTAGDVMKKKLMETPKINEDLAKKLESLKKRDFRLCIPNPDIELYKRLRALDMEIPPDMYPLTNEERAILNDGVSHEQLGKYAFFRDRNKKSPENKFRYPILTNWLYGWQLDDVIKKEDIKKPIFGCVNHIETDFYSRNGIPYTRKQDIQDVKRVPL